MENPKNVGNMLKINVDRLDMDLEVLGLTCRVCGEKIFYKIRPSTKKTVVSD